MICRTPKQIQSSRRDTITAATAAISHSRRLYFTRRQAYFTYRKAVNFTHRRWISPAVRQISLQKQAAQRAARFYNCQSISLIPFALKNSLHFEKCLQPKKPRYADKGLGCGASRIKCFELLSKAFFSCAGLPQSRNTTGRSTSFTVRMMASVNCSQPFPR